jgi:hypothetical protein
MEITIGWWAVPAFATIAAVYIVLREAPTSSGRDYGEDDLSFYWSGMAALIVSLIAWIIWALFT